MLKTLFTQGESLMGALVKRWGGKERDDEGRPRQGLPRPGIKIQGLWEHQDDVEHSNEETFKVFQTEFLNLCPKGGNLLIP